MLGRHIRKIIPAVILCISIILSIPYYNRAVEAGTPRHVNDGWTVSTPDLQGMDTKLLSEADRFISKTDAVSMIVVKNDRIVFERYYRGQVPKDLCFAYPTANSLLAALTGIVIGTGKIKNADQKISDYFPKYTSEIESVNAQNITIRELLTMTSGLSEPDEDIFSTWDWIGNLLALPTRSQPGSNFSYSPKVWYLLSGILTNATGMTAAQLAGNYIFDPIKASSGVWHTGPEGMNTGGGYLYLRPADIAKFGCLYLNNGVWKGQSVIPGSWVKESLKIQVDLRKEPVKGMVGPFEGYGYGFFIRSIDDHLVFTTEGDGSLQNLCIIPDLDIVLVVTSYHSIFKKVFSYKDLNNLLQKYIIPAAGEFCNNRLQGGETV
jgi:Beta-lactamase class C and other penicillin binding proteins